MFKDFFNRLLPEHRGKAIGVSIGFIVGVTVLIMGFWKTFFLCLCTGIGYWLGGMSDKREKLIAFLERVLPEGPKDRY